MPLSSGGSCAHWEPSRRYWIEAGRRDEYYLDLGASAFHQALLEVGVRLEKVNFELFDGAHGGIKCRYPQAIRWLTQRLVTEGQQ